MCLKYGIKVQVPVVKITLTLVGDMVLYGELILVEQYLTPKSSNIHPVTTVTCSLGHYHSASSRLLTTPMYALGNMIKLAAAPCIIQHKAKGAFTSVQGIYEKGCKALGLLPSNSGKRGVMPAPASSDGRAR